VALVDVVKYEPSSDEYFAWKYPSENLKIGSQLIVNEGQQAIFVKGGEALDTFMPGTHTLSTGNLPLIEKIINSPFGGKTPFTAEVWFLNTTVKRNLKWGTPSPIPLMDPTIGFPVNARAFGDWGVRISNSRSFITQLVGAQIECTSEKIYSYFVSQVVQSFSQFMSSFISSSEASILNISTMLSKISSSASVEMAATLDKFGLELINFNIESINIPEKDMEQIQNVYAKSFEARELSKVQLSGSYGAIKSFEVLNNAATNEGDGAVGAMLGAGAGLGAGLSLGNELTKNINASSNQETSNDDIASKIRKLKNLLEEGLISQEQFDMKQSKLLEDL